MIIKFAFKTIQKNKKRSIVTLLLGTFCAAFLIFFQAFNEGGHHKMIADAVEIYTGYIQIQGKDYRDNPDYDHIIEDTDAILQEISTIPTIKNTTIRFEAPSLFSSHEKTVGGLLVGIDPEKEATASRIKKALKKGKYLSSDATNDVYIGSELAKRLQVDIDDEIVFLSSTTYGSTAAQPLHIQGIFQTNLFDFDGHMAFINKSFMDLEFFSDNMATSLIVVPENTDEWEPLYQELTQVFSNQDIDIVSWKTLLSDFIQFVKLDEAMGVVSISVLLVVVFFVMLIFWMIALFQRTHEIGILRAIGTSPKQIVLILLAEASIFSLISTVCGGLLGIGLSLYFEHNPLTLQFSEEVMTLYKQFGVVEAVYPAKLSLHAVLYGIVPVCLLNIFSALLPLRHLIKAKPIDVLRGEL